MDKSKGSFLKRISSDKKTIAGFASIFFACMIALTFLARGAAGVLAAKVKLIQPYNDKVKQAIEISATVSTAKSKDVIAPAELVINEVLVSVGEDIEEGAEIAAVDKKQLEEKLAQERIELDTLKLSLKNAKRNVSDLISSIDLLKTKLVWAEQDYETQKDKNEISLKSAQHALDTSLLAQTEAEEELEDLASGISSEDYVRVRKERDIAKTEVVSAKENLARLQGMVTPDNPYTKELEELRILLQVAQENLDIKQSELDLLYEDVKEKRKAAERTLTAAKENVFNARQSLSQMTQNNEESLRNAERSIQLAKQAIDEAQKRESSEKQTERETAEQNSIKQKSIELDIKACEEIIAFYEEISSDGRIKSRYSGKAVSVVKAGSVKKGDIIAAISDNKSGYRAIAEISSKTDVEVGMSGAVLSNELYSQGESGKAVLASLDQTLNPEVVQAVFEIEGSYKIGETVRVEVSQNAAHTGICFPITALHQNSDGYFVYVMKQKNGVLGIQNIVQLVGVEILAKNNEAVAVKSGIAMGDKIVTFSSKPLSDGDVVREQIT